MGSGVSPDAAAKAIAQAVTARKPRTRYTIGREAALLAHAGKSSMARTTIFAISASMCWMR